MRNYQHIDAYLDDLSKDIYEQPEDEGHTQLAYEFIQWMQVFGSKYVLDIGCGDGFCQPFLERKGMDYLGIALGKDVNIARGLGHTVVEMDLNFISSPDESFDLVVSRHSLEHSVMPVISLMEWHRVSRKWLGLVMPNPSHYGFVGRNHLSVAWPHQIAWWLRRAGWKIRQVKLFNEEFWFVCEKRPVISYEGWATTPLPTKVYEFERDLKINVEIEEEAFEKYLNEE